MSPEVHAELCENCEVEGSQRGRETEGSDCGRPGRLLEEVEVEEAHWVGEGEEMERGLEPDAYLSCPRRVSEQAMSTAGEVFVRFDDGRRAFFDYIWLATGGNLDLSLVPILSSLLEQCPIPVADGLPLLQTDLSWAADCPFYVMGAFAQLVLGPDALNLAGARSGGVAVATALRAACEPAASSSPDA